jgi:hypothetical protein
MNITSVTAALGLAAVVAASTAAAAEDFSAAIDAAQTGINLYAITEKGASLVPGGPFTPTKLPYVIPSGVAVVPLMVQMSTAHHYLYAIYAELSGAPNILVQYTVNPTGLTENWAVVTDFNGSNNLLRVAGLQSLVATGNEIIVYYHYPWGLSAEVFSAAGKVLAKADSSPSGQPVLESVRVDPDANLYYACFLNNSQVYVSVFDLPKGRLLQNSTDPVFIASECD